jgi:hypothetical protein
MASSSLRIIRFHAAAVQDLHPDGRCQHFLQPVARTQHRVHFLRHVGVAVLPVPMAQTGSYATTIFCTSETSAVTASTTSS